ncbi:MAG: phosphoribosylanthranilate isomerase, partial [Bacteroidota bacterium]
YEKSSRFVGPQTAEQRGEIIRLSQEAGIQRVGVFVNAERTYIEQMIADYALDVLQLHGEESVAECGFWKARGLQIWKVFSVGSTFDFGQLTAYDAMCDAFLFDTKGAKRGGNGRTFDWSVLSDYKQDKAFVLSGGIQVEMASEIADLPFAQLSVVDINSRFELSPAHKDLERIDQFLKKLKRK